MDNHVTRLQYNDKEIILIGTAHVSQRSVQQVKEIIEHERPDAVCIELDQQRYLALIDTKQWNETEIFQIIKQKKAILLLINLIIAAFQKRLADNVGIMPGQEMVQAFISANIVGAKLVLIDRNIQVTFQRIWNSLGFIGKVKFLILIISSMLTSNKVSTTVIEDLKNQDTLAVVLQELNKQFPQLKQALIDERDQYMAQKIKTTPGNKIIVVVGAAHIPGIIKQIEFEHDLNRLNSIPSRKRWSKIIPWLIPLTIVGIIGYTLTRSLSLAAQQSLAWILWNGILSALGVALALGHPLTMLTAFIIAPISSINPFLTAGWLTGIVEASLQKPKVKDFMTLGDDVTSIRGFWKNKVSRILLVVVLTDIFSAIGTIIGSVDIIRIFLNNIYIKRGV